ncbi:hypothetical protein BD311DRAFT_241810 [Dichomitus squalens]|uniref:Uncharacterized protein n=1 Tax=Dichomitus squalens TaxID=114155 RepID=A0A4V2K0T4_9APHY|nr:hypothetical protein BD311DRAFT_241810 [Dichomitus squalens]
MESHVKESQERLRSTINDAVSGLRDDIKKDVLELRDQLEKPISELRQQISTSTCSSLACGSAARTSRSRSRSRTRSRSQKRPRPTYPDDPDSSDLTTSPSDSKKRRLGGHPLVAAALSVLTTDPATPVISGQRSRAGSNVPGTRIHSLRVAGATSHSSSASPKVPLSTVVARASKKTPLRTPLADLTPQVPKVTPNASTPRSTSVSSVVKQTRGSRSVPHTLIAASAGLPSQGFSSSQFNNQDPAPVLPRRSMRSSPPTATFAAPITPGSFKLPLPALRPSRASTFATHTPPQLHPSSSLLRHPALGAHKDHKDNENKNSNNNSPLARSSATAGAILQQRTPAQATRGTALHLSRSSSRAVAVQDRASPSRLPVKSALRTGIGADSPVSVNSSGTPRMPRLLASFSVNASDGPAGSDVLPGSADLEKGKPMSLKDRRALLAAECLRDEGKRFIPLDDEDDEHVYLGG